MCMCSPTPPSYNKDFAKTSMPNDISQKKEEQEKKQPTSFGGPETGSRNNPLAAMSVCHEPYCLDTKDMPSLVFCQNFPDDADKKTMA